MDYPTWNQHYKGKASQYWYAIGPSSMSAHWFDELVKVDSNQRAVVRTWSSPGMLLTEPTFVPVPDGSAEDDGVLVSVLFNSTSNTSVLAVFDAHELAPVSMQQLPAIIPFHAHAVTCLPGAPHCLTNP